MDLAWNIPYILGSIEKRATLSLGARFDIVDDPNAYSDKELKFLRKLVERLDLNSGRILKKISAHLDIYGNSYVHVRRDSEGRPNKLTILQPERMKIFLDPMTTKILFYVYLPPIIGGTVLVPYPYEKPNPNLIQNIALTYPTPIIIPPEDIMHLKQTDWTEYPFGFSRLRPAMEAAQARLDFTILSPIIYKHYSKPIIHWMLDPTGLNPQQVLTRLQGFKSDLETTEPTSDLLTTNRWTHEVITGVSKGFSAAFDMINDADSQIFAALGAPETYFKPRGTTDRMLTEQDKIFVKEMRDRQEYFSEEIRHKLFFSALKSEFEYDYENMPVVPIRWRKMIMSDDSIEIQNAIALLEARIITVEEARNRLSLPKTASEAQKEIIKNFVDSPTDQLNQQLPQGGQPVAMGGPGGAAAAAPKPLNVFQGADAAEPLKGADASGRKKSAVDPQELVARFGARNGAPSQVGPRDAGAGGIGAGMDSLPTLEDNTGEPGSLARRAPRAARGPAVKPIVEIAEDDSFTIGPDGSEGTLPKFASQSGPAGRKCPYCSSGMNMGTDGAYCATHGGPM